MRIRRTAIANTSRRASARSRGTRRWHRCTTNGTTRCGDCGPTADGARALRETFTAIDPDSGALVHDFTDPELDTRFLGDLYQDLSEAAKKRYALLQTPEFVERFILDRTLDPAIEEFGLEDVRLIDPTCGSGHFLIGAFDRLFALWQAREPATSSAVLAQRCLDQIAGVDLNPYATAIARFRLIIAALRRAGSRAWPKPPRSGYISRPVTVCFTARCRATARPCSSTPTASAITSRTSTTLRMQQS